MTLSSLGSYPTDSKLLDGSGLFDRFCVFGSKAVTPGVLGPFCSLNSPLNVLVLFKVFPNPERFLKLPSPEP